MIMNNTYHTHDTDKDDMTAPEREQWLIDRGVCIEKSGDFSTFYYHHFCIHIISLIQTLIRLLHLLTFRGRSEAKGCHRWGRSVNHRSDSKYIPEEKYKLGK